MSDQGFTKQAMKNGIFNNWRKGQSPTSDLETPTSTEAGAAVEIPLAIQKQEFLNNVYQAKLGAIGDTEMPWVETTRAVMEDFNRPLGGLKGKDTFIFDGCIICENGRTEELKEKMNKPLQKTLHGDQEALVNV